jgi:hypothetical protein
VTGPGGLPPLRVAALGPTARRAVLPSSAYLSPAPPQEWSDLPAPYKYLGVKVNPEHVEAHGPVWKFFSDWKTAVPASILLTLP